MITSRKSLAVAAAVVCCLVLAWFATSIHGGQRTYEVRPYVVPEYRTDAGRAIDAYERLMERHMDLTEKNLFAVAADVQNISTKLSLIDAKLAELSLRMGRIEKALGIGASVNSTSSAHTLFGSPRGPAQQGLAPGQTSSLKEPQPEQSSETPEAGSSALMAEIFGYRDTQSQR